MDGQQVVSIELEQLVSAPEPVIVIYDDILDAEEEIAQYVNDELVGPLAPLILSPQDDKAFKDKLGIALRSIAFLIAESVSTPSAETKDAAHLQREHFEFAKAHLPREAVAIVHLFNEWEKSIQSCLYSLLETTSRKEAIFCTCERFKIDLVEFSRVFPQPTFSKK